MGTKTEDQRTRPDKLRNPEDNRTGGPKDHALKDQSFRRQRTAFGWVLKIRNLRSRRAVDKRTQ
jgi:hypothetical protein